MYQVRGNADLRKTARRETRGRFFFSRALKQFILATQLLQRKLEQRKSPAKNAAAAKHVGKPGIFLPPTCCNTSASRQEAA